jgi:hypothetical protein
MIRSLALLLSFPAVPAAEWPEWRGPDAQGHAAAAGLPLNWGEGTNVVWRSELPGRGWSTPVVKGSEIWVTTARETPATEEEKQARLKANTGNQPLTLMGEVSWHALRVDRESGRILDDIRLFARQAPQWVHELNSYASPSPVLDGDRLYAQFGAYGTACVDLTTRAVVWTNTEAALEVMHENGPGGSPVLWRDLLCFHLDGSDRQFVVALDKRTGSLRWKTDRSGTMHKDPQLKKSYGTPLLLELGGEPVVISQGSNWLYGYHPADGTERWKVDYGILGFSVSTRPVSDGRRVYYSTGFMKPEMQAVDLVANPPAIVWRYAKGVPQVPSPILAGGHLFFASDKGGIVTCLDAETGAERFRERLQGNFSAAPIHAEGRLYFNNREGETFVIAAEPAFRLLASNRLDGRLLASPVAVGRSLFLRTDRALYRIEDLGLRT